MFGIVSGKEGVRGFSSIWACCSVNTVDIVFRIIWEVKVDYKFDIGDV